MSISRECVLHFPFPMKAWLVADCHSIDAIYWMSEDGIMVDQIKLQNYLKTSTSIFNTKSIADILVQFTAYGFECLQHSLPYIIEFRHELFQHEIPQLLRFMSIEGFNLNFGMTKHNLLVDNPKMFDSLSSIDLMDFGDFGFEICSFEDNIDILRNLMINLCKYEVLLQEVKLTYVESSEELMDCHHMHNIIFPATWYPGVGVSVVQQTGNSHKNYCDELLYNVDLDTNPQSSVMQQLQKQHLAEALIKPEELEETLLEAYAIPLRKDALLPSPPHYPTYTQAELDVYDADIALVCMKILEDSKNSINAANLTETADIKENFIDNISEPSDLQIEDLIDDSKVKQNAPIDSDLLSFASDASQHGSLTSTKYIEDEEDRQFDEMMHFYNSKSTPSYKRPISKEFFEHNQICNCICRKIYTK